MEKSTKIVAEISANHHQNYLIARELISQAKLAGADAVKIQMFTADQMTLDSNDEKFMVKSGPWKGFSLYQLYKNAEMPLSWATILKKYAEELGIEFFTSVYHPDIIERTEALNIPIYKISSFEITYDDLLDAVGKTKKPIIISTGMADYKEIKHAVSIIKKYHNDITLLKCTSNYPATYDSLNLKTMPALGHSFKTKFGFSDHTTGITAPVVAASLGAQVIEKHLTLDNKGLDGGFSINPQRFKVMVEAIRAAEKSLGEIVYGGEKKFRRENVNGKYVRVSNV